MSDLSHLRIESSATSLPYTSTKRGGRKEFRVPPRDRVPHAQRLAGGLRQAEGEAASIREHQPAADDSLDGIPITLRSDAGFELPTESLERLREGIELLSVRRDIAGITVANLFVRRDKIVNLLRLIERYEREDDARNGLPKNRKLVESISSIRLLAIADLWQDDPTLFPASDQAIWWEVWGRRGTEEPVDAFDRLLQAATSVQVRMSPRFVVFPERVVTLAYGTSRQLGASIDLLTMIAELRRAKEVPTAYLELHARDQRDFVNEAASRLIPPVDHAPAVCLLDTGVNRSHPLIEPALAAADWQAVDPAWLASDHHPQQHGTAMAGMALYRCLTDVFTSSGPIQLRHRLESVKLLPPPPQANDPEVYGWVTQQAVATAEIAAPDRNRAICMAVTTGDDRDHGLPSSWSAAIDQMCAGALDEHPKLIFISTGNYEAVMQDPGYRYPNWNCDRAGVQDPSQAWNALAVGGCTDLVSVSDPNFERWNPIAGAGDLSPTSRTSNSWPLEDQRGWPIKPDIVMEGGNYVENGTMRDACTDLSLLTTIVKPSGALLTHAADTSAATAAAARAAAIVWSHYPRLWPESVRALIVHSAEWTPAMMSRFPGSQRSDVQQRLRCYGFGVPNLNRAIYSSENAATLIFEGSLQPFERARIVNVRGGRAVTEHRIKTKEMHLHKLPWPEQVLQDLGDASVTMRLTLSYFIEPSPGRKGWGRKFRFASHGLRFDVKSPLETLDAFQKRVSKAVWEEEEGRPENVPETRNWSVGPKHRTHGSIHSDWWQGTASELAASGYVAVYPVTGWWRERQHLGRLESLARYSLIISIETPEQTVDLYHAIENLATVTAEVTA